MPFRLAEVKTLPDESEGKMQNIELENIRPQIQAYIKDVNPAEKIAGLFYYSSAAILWTAWTLGLIFFLIYLFLAPGVAVMMLIIGLIYGFPGWIWAGIGVFLFRCHKKRYTDGLQKTDAILMWLGTIIFNGIQATYIFNYLDVSLFGNVVAGWNLIAAALSGFALYFDLRMPKTSRFW